jgi:hypothetical protein
MIEQIDFAVGCASFVVVVIITGFWASSCYDTQKFSSEELAKSWAYTHAYPADTVRCARAATEDGLIPCEITRRTSAFVLCSENSCTLVKIVE